MTVEDHDRRTDHDYRNRRSNQTRPPPVVLAVAVAIVLIGLLFYALVMGPPRNKTPLELAPTSQLLPSGPRR
jgi:hypothetical protein